MDLVKIQKTICEIELLLSEIKQPVVIKEFINFSPKLDITKYIANNKSFYSTKILANRTGLSKNELAYNIRELIINPVKWNNSWVLAQDEVKELMSFLLKKYKLKEIKILKKHMK